VKAAIYKCPYCKFEDAIAVRDLKNLYDFDENDIATYPKVECDICHRTEHFPSEIKEMPDELFPEHPYIEELRKAGKLDEFIEEYKKEHKIK
jgi:hypothetical protein